MCSSLYLFRKSRQRPPLLPHSGSELCLQGSDQEHVQDLQGRSTGPQIRHQHCKRRICWNPLSDVCLLSGLRQNQVCDESLLNILFFYRKPRQRPPVLPHPGSELCLQGPDQELVQDLQGRSPGPEIRHQHRQRRACWYPLSDVRLLPGLRQNQVGSFSRVPFLVFTAISF